MPIKVIILEDDAELRQNLQEILEISADMVCVAGFGNAEDFVAQAKQYTFDVVISDIQLPNKSGIECVSILKPLYPQVQFLMWTVFEDNDKIFEALCEGATGYLLKKSLPTQIIEAVRDIYQGGSPMSSEIARKVINSFQRIHKPTQSFDDLSEREQELLNLLAKGHRYKEIASQLFISIDTVRTHIQNIYRKLQVNSRIEAVNKVFPKY